MGAELYKAADIYHENIIRKKLNMLNEEALKIVLNDKTFGQREAADIVGGRGELFRLVGSGAIRAEKRPADRQNGRWYCNAWDVIKHAKLRF